jgi:hypothetical protein
MNDDDFEDEDDEELEPGGEIVTLTCTTCGAVTTVPGFAGVEMFICSECGATVEVGEGQVE